MLWAVSLLGLMVIWLGLAWLVRKLVGIEFGLHSPTAVWIVLIALPACGIYAIVSAARRIKRRPHRRPLLPADLDAGQVDEEHYEFTDAKRFQEPEHGGLIYFLRTTSGEVITLYDRESQDLGARGKDPMNSSFAPRSDLMIVRAPRTRFVIKKSFSGARLKVGQPVELCVQPDRWPEDEAYCEVPWSELETRFGPVEPEAVPPKPA